MQARRRHRAAVEQNLERGLRRQHFREGIRAPAVGREADLDVGHDELRVLRGDDEVAAEAHREPAAGRSAFDRGDDRLRALAHRHHPIVQRVEQLAKRMKGEQIPQYFKGRDAEDYVLATW